ncbi:unnamed protein product [Scytosiphon promiscuus]
MRGFWFRAGAFAQLLAVVWCWAPHPGTRGGRRSNIVDMNIEPKKTKTSRPCVASFCLRSRKNRRRSSAAASMSSDRARSGSDIADSRPPPRILGLGSAGVDFLAAVDRYPSADEKVRTQSLEIMGGGNCGNTLSAASRLGLDACIATKVGSDANGRLILQGLREEGVDVSRVVVSDATPSAFTYIIVDKEGGTRTCLHTPQTEDILPEEIKPELLDGVAAVHLDSRHTPAAIALAKLANQRDIPVILDAEKDRPFFKDLLPLADYVICNRNFPQAFTGSDSHESAIRELLQQGRARMVVTTLGAEGCIVVSREEEQPWHGYNDFSTPDGCKMAIKTDVMSDAKPSASSAGASSDKKEISAPARYVWVSCWPVRSSDVVDTTGAGDCFMAGLIYGMTHRLGIGRTLALSSLVAARKLSAPGARRGVPTLDQLKAEWPELLTPV